MDGVPELKGRVQVRHERVGLIEGGTAELRTKAAESLAERLNAHLLIYGNLSRQDSTSFIPEFFIAGMRGADEATGPIPWRDGLSLLPAASPIETRFQSVLFFVLGLASLSWEQYDDAIAYFTKATALAERSRGGEEMFHLLLGSAYKARKYRGDLDFARRAYETSLDFNPEYGRAYLGLGKRGA